MLGLGIILPVVHNSSTNSQMDRKSCGDNRCSGLYSYNRLNSNSSIKFSLVDLGRNKVVRKWLKELEPEGRQERGCRRWATLGAHDRKQGTRWPG